jgi:hypothetical protein
MRCSKCGIDDPDDFSICTECGHPRSVLPNPGLGGEGQYGFQAGGGPALAPPGLPVDGPVATLVGIEGPVEGLEVRLDRPEMGIGRRSDCEILISDPSVSRLHAWVRAGPGGYTIEDAGSSNGTWVNGVRLVGPRPLAERDVLRIGKAAFVFQSEVPGLPRPLGGVTMVSDIHDEPSPFQQPSPALDVRPVVNSAPPRPVDLVQPLPPRPVEAPGPLPQRPAPRQLDIVAPPEPPVPVRPAAPARREPGPGQAAKELASARAELGDLRRELGRLGERLESAERLATSLEERLDAVESAGRSSPLLDELRDELESAGGDENFRTLQRLLDELRGDTGDIKLLVRLSDELSSINRLLQFHTRTLSLIRKLQSV